MKKIIIITILILLITNYENKKITINNDIKDTKIDKIGLIEIKKIMVNSEIIEGSDINKLNQNKVGHVKESSLEFDETIILAGHYDTVFKGLDRLKNNDIIYLTIYGKKEKYIVKENIIIYDNDYTNFTKEENKLILITCTNEIKKRRIVIAYKV